MVNLKWFMLTHFKCCHHRKFKSATSSIQLCLFIKLCWLLDWVDMWKFIITPKHSNSQNRCHDNIEKKKDMFLLGISMLNTVSVIQIRIYQNLSLFYKCNAINQALGQSLSGFQSNVSLNTSDLFFYVRGKNIKIIKRWLT